MSNHQSGSHGHSENHEHHIFSYENCFKAYLALLVLTAITVGVAFIDLGKLNLTVALLVASIKSFVVCAYFMGLKYDKKENGVIFVTSFLFLIIFIVLTSFDLFYRGDVYVNKAVADKFELAAQKAGGTSKFEKPWNDRPEMVANGKILFEAQCVVCHGAAGKGDGPAAAGLNPKPRNFTEADGWKNGRKPSQIFTTLTKGLGGMPAFGNLSADDRWSLAHYVTHFATDQLKDSDDDLKKAGIDPSGKATAAVAAELPIDLAIEILAK